MANDVIDLDELSSSINGFEQIAIKKAFGESFSTLGQTDAMQFMYACYFVHLKREGQNDRDARQNALNLGLKELTESFSSGTELDPTAEQDRDREWAEFVIGVGLPFTVSQFMELTVSQKAEAIKAAEKVNKQKG